ncbi:nucleoside-diphosphate-sugar epimerase [Parvibaculum indicum]|uniref:SDR family NAD(P)-dependent oxidoreductase n=1 Tax=Parvibaculum indicum TaxID=562969 RepID=UPI0014229370|nr:SDR family NAD(P)-dependent oxidoreductase [Parvibaculum indicum]NIJ42531.1 nucleoside-diphosphate-sugar epimerase [Parvibaculum indicum]
MTDKSRKTVLIIGATGGIGGAVTRALAARGWTIRALNRKPEAAARTHAALGPVEWVKGDAMNPADVIRAAEGVSLIFHGANPPGYRNWKGLALPMLESTIAAAKASGAMIAFPGTVYNFGPDAGVFVNEEAPQNPKTRKGGIRVEMENRLRETAQEGTQVLILRAGDFLGGLSANNWFAAAIVKPGRKLRRVVYPGVPQVGHDWAYLPDLADTFAQLVERRDELGAFERFHFEGYWFRRGIELAEATCRAAGNEKLPIRRFPWWLIRLASPFVETFREMLEMHYLWRKPLHLDNAKLVAFLGEEPRTPVEIALRDCLIELGCMKPPTVKAIAASRKNAATA